jgi:hypothetical protein
MSEKINYSMGELLPNPLPQVNVPYKECWGDMYDFYGNRVELKSKHPIGGIYNWSVDNVHNAWCCFIYPFFEYHRKSGNKFKETEIAEADKVIMRIYGGFDFDSFIKMIHHDPHIILDPIEVNKNLWYDALYKEKLNEFCKKHNILDIKNIPPLTLGSMHDLFQRHLESWYSGSIVDRDWYNKFNFSVGLELSNHFFYEMKASDIINYWVMGSTIKDLSGAVVGMNINLQSLSSTCIKPGFFEKLFYKIKLEQVKRKLSWGLYLIDHNNETIKIQFSDIIKFYPPSVK